MGTHDAILLDFSADMNMLTLWFFKGMAEAAQSLFEAWVNGELALTVESVELPAAPQSGKESAGTDSQNQ